MRREKLYSESSPRKINKARLREAEAAGMDDGSTLGAGAFSDRMVVCEQREFWRWLCWRQCAPRVRILRF